MKTYKIGRLTSNNICYNHDSISRQHADLTCMDDGRILLTDHSKNGTTVNGRSITNTTVELHRGDNVVFAGVAHLDWSNITDTNTIAPNGGNIPGGYVGPTQEKNGMAIAGFVLAFLFPLLGLIFSIIGLNRSNELQSRKGHGLSVAGIIISALNLAFALLINIMFSLL